MRMVSGGCWLTFLHHVEMRIEVAVSNTSAKASFIRPRSAARWAAEIDDRCPDQVQMFDQEIATLAGRPAKAKSLQRLGARSGGPWGSISIAGAPRRGFERADLVHIMAH